MTIEPIYLWVGFTLFILAMLALDLGVFQRRPHVIGMKEALGWFAFWTCLALLFNLGILLFHERGGQAALEFFTGYLVEKSLSVDNIFVFILIFNYFSVPPAYQHKVLFWGILGAIALRVVFILAGLALLAKFHWMIYVFGGFLLFTGVTMMLRKDTKVDPAKNWALRAFRKLMPISENYEGNQFFARINGRLHATPLLLVLVAIESSDIVFAADSIPAIFAITPDPFIVYTSNVFAMLGLRALYFALSGFMQMFWFLHYGFASIIMILGVKMLVSEYYEVPVAVSLALIVFILMVCLIISLLRPRKADIKPMLERTERLGLIPFRRLLLMENVIDLGDLKVRDAMRDIGGVSVLHLEAPWADNLKTIRATCHSRFPLVARDQAKPLGVVHVKDLIVGDLPAPPTAENLKAIARPVGEVSENLALEEALARFQRRYDHLAVVVNDQGEWTGIITIEDILEEIVGKIGDEFDTTRVAERVSLADALSPSRVVFDLDAETMREAIEKIVASIPREELPVEPQKVTEAVLRREQLGATYLGDGLAVPHARLENLDRPILAFARSDSGIPVPHSNNDRAEFIFLLLTPSRAPRLQVWLLADLADLLDSEYVVERFKTARTAEELIEAIRAGQQVAID